MQAAVAIFAIHCSFAEADAEIGSATEARSRRGSALHSRTSSIHQLAHSGSGLGLQGAGQGGGLGASGGASLMEAAVSKVFAQRSG